MCIVKNKSDFDLFCEDKNSSFFLNAEKKCDKKNYFQKNNGIALHCLQILLVLLPLR